MSNKPNPMLAKIEEKYAREYALKFALAEENFNRMLKMGMQIASDAALMAADDTFDVNAYSAEKFHAAHIKYVNDISQLTIDDSEDDRDIIFTKTDVDRRLLQIVGKDNFISWDERYISEGNKK